jgi:hypothetical protein
VLDLDDCGEKNFKEFLTLLRIFVEESSGSLNEQTLGFKILAVALTRFQKQIAHCN